MHIGEYRKNTLSKLLRFILVLVGAACAILLFAGLIKKLVFICFGALVFSFLISPLCRLFEKKLERSRAALAAIACAAALIFGVAALLLPALYRQMTDLLALLPASFERIQAMIKNAGRMLRQYTGGFQLPELNLSGAQSGLMETVQGAADAMSGFTGGIYRLFLMISLSYFLMADRDRMLLLAELMVPLHWRKYAVRAGNALLRDLRLYLRGQATIAAAVGSLAICAMFLLGLPGAPVLGIIVGIFNVIPYFGPFLGGIPAVIAALSISWQRALFTVGALFLVQQADGLLISPRIMGSITGFSPAVVLLSIFAGGQIGGIGGMLFALPSILAIRTVYRVFVQRNESN